jgi:hypothetical protein
LNNPPQNWPPECKREYFDWTKRVVDAVLKRRLPNYMQTVVPLHKDRLDIRRRISWKERNALVFQIPFAFLAGKEVAPAGRNTFGPQSDALGWSDLILRLRPQRGAKTNSQHINTASGHHRTRFHDTSISASLFPRFRHCLSSLPHQSIESWPKRYTTFGRSRHRAPLWSFKFRDCFRGQLAVISSDHSNSFASIPWRSIRR